MSDQRTSQTAARRRASRRRVGATTLVTAVALLSTGCQIPVPDGVVGTGNCRITWLEPYLDTSGASGEGGAIATILNFFLGLVPLPKCDTPTTDPAPSTP